MLDLLKDLTEASNRLNEKFDGLSPDQLFYEIMAQYKNLETYKPRDPQELQKTAGAIIGSAQDLIQAVTELMGHNRKV